MSYEAFSNLPPSILNKIYYYVHKDNLDALFEELFRTVGLFDRICSRRLLVLDFYRMGALSFKYSLFWGRYQEFGLLGGCSINRFSFLGGDRVSWVDTFVGLPVNY